MVTRYDTTQLQEQDSLAYWHEVICKFFPRATCERSEHAPFLASLDRVVLGTVDVTQIRCGPLRYERQLRDQRADRNEDFLISLLTQGRARLEQGSRVTVQEAGEFVLYDAARPFVYEFPGEYQMLLLRVPRRVMLCRLPDAERLTAVNVSGMDSLGTLAASLMRSASTLELPTEGPAAAKVGMSIVDILTAAFDTSLSNKPELCDRQAALLKRAKDYIRSRLDEPDLDVDAIADAVHVSPRTLSRAFSSEGTTVIRWLWRERLEMSYAALSEGRVTHVTDVALGCGFVSSSHFSRLFKSAYGVLPHTMLRGRESLTQTLQTTVDLA